MSESDKKEQIDALTQFKNRNRLSISCWNQNRLYPASDRLDCLLNDAFKTCAAQLINALNGNVSQQQLGKILRANLAALNNDFFVREERVFICDFFNEISNIIEVDLSKDLNRWLYGWFLGTMLNLQNILKPVAVIETLVQPCGKCGTHFETYILKKEKGVGEANWSIVRCKRCREFNLISVGDDVTDFVSESYEWQENISTSEFTFEQAVTRLEQIRYFRK